MPASLAYQQLGTLRQAILVAFPGPIGQARVRVVFGDIGEGLETYAVTGASFEETLRDALATLNRKETLETLFARLRQENRPDLDAAIAGLVSSVAAVTAADPRQILVSKGLLVEGEPFLDREQLRNKILPDLLNPEKPVRAVVIQGQRDTGKSFSLRMMRLHSRLQPSQRRFRVIEINLSTTTARECADFAKEVAEALLLENVRVPERDTGEPRIARRLTDALARAREYAERTVPTILVFDHLDKDISPAIVDFAEEIALAAADGRFADLRVVLIGFPRRPSSEFTAAKLLPETTFQPGPIQVGEYIDLVLETIQHDVDDDTLNRLVELLFAGRTPPYPRDFMLDLPGQVNKMLDDIIRG